MVQSDSVSRPERVAAEDLFEQIEEISWEPALQLVGSPAELQESPGRTSRGAVMEREGLPQLYPSPQQYPQHEAWSGGAIVPQPARPLLPGGKRIVPILLDAGKGFDSERFTFSKSHNGPGGEGHDGWDDTASSAGGGGGSDKKVRRLLWHRSVLSCALLMMTVLAFCSVLLSYFHARFDQGELPAVSTFESDEYEPDPGSGPVPVGVVRKVTLVLGWIRVPVPGKPNATRMMIGINGTTPGPEIRAYVGDTLAITVLSTMPDVNTTIHWHGITHHTSPWADGVPGITQCLIPPAPTGGMSGVVYRMRLSSTGTYWYHGHYHEQYVDGLVGSLVVMGKPEVHAALYDREWTWLASDFYATMAHDMAAKYLSTLNPDGYEPLPDAIWVNGKFSKDLAYTAQAKSKVRVRCTNVAALSWFNVSVDGLPLTLIELDGQDIKPMVVPWVLIHTSQRVSFVLDFSAISGGLGQGGAPIWFRINALADNYPLGVSGNYSWQGFKTLDPLFLGAISFTGATGSQPALPTYPASAVPFQPQPRPDSNVIYAKPIPAFALPRPDHQMLLSINFGPDANGVNVASVNGMRWMNTGEGDADLYKFLNLAPTGVTGTPAEVLAPPYGEGTDLSADAWNVTEDFQRRFYLPLNSWVEMFIVNYDQGPHPIHLHGHKMFVVASSEVIGAEFKNLPHYSMRDTAVVQASADGVVPAWLKVQFLANDPGTWNVHCHIDWHMVAGLSVEIVEGGDALQDQATQAPNDMLRLCGMARTPAAEQRHQADVAAADALLAKGLRPKNGVNRRQLLGWGPARAR